MNSNSIIDLVERLHVASRAVYLATEIEVANDISKLLIKSADIIEELHAKVTKDIT